MVHLCITVVAVSGGSPMGLEVGCRLVLGGVSIPQLVLYCIVYMVFFLR